MRQLFCINCGKRVFEGAKFCAFCGAKLLNAGSFEPEPEPEVIEQVSEPEPVLEPEVMEHESESEPEPEPEVIEQESEPEVEPEPEPIVEFLEAPEPTIIPGHRMIVVNEPEHEAMPESEPEPEPEPEPVPEPEGKVYFESIGADVDINDALFDLYNDSSEGTVYLVGQNGAGQSSGAEKTGTLKLSMNEMRNGAVKILDFGTGQRFEVVVPTGVCAGDWLLVKGTGLRDQTTGQECDIRIRIEE